MINTTRQSFWALNGVNFFLAQIAAVVIPFLNVYLREHGWRYDQIGIAMAAAGLGSLMFQIPAGLTCDRIERPRDYLAVMALILGACYFGVPLFVEHVSWIVLLLFVSGIPGTFFAPLLASLAIFLGGRLQLSSILGTNQSWNHAGSVAAALIALVVVRAMGIEPLFYTAGAVAILAAISTMMIRPSDLKYSDPPETEPWFNMRIFYEKTKVLLHNHEVKVLLLAVGLFHVANGPMGPLVSLFMKLLGSDDSKIAWIVLVAQPIMIPAAWLAGKYASKIGAKKLLAMSFWLLPVRMILYALAQTPNQVLAVTAIDGIVGGVYGVVLILICSDLALGKRAFNSLMGLIYTSPAVGAVLGLALQGFLVESFGFRITFAVFAMIATAAAAVVTWLS